MKRGLEIKLLNYFLLITIAAMMIGVEFFFEMSKTDLVTEICDLANMSIISKPLLNLRNKIVIMFGVLTIVVAIVLMMFIRNITWPLQNMVNVAKKINEGDLSQVIKIKSKDELEQLAIAINDLTRNLQEIAIFTATTSNIVNNRINAIAAQKGQTTATITELKAIVTDLEALREFVSLFNTDPNKQT
ncbi:hypothetical protein TI03_02125 [Achromatium sp. WMS1]|nr:hypothetical protein TI03_02125 [Achromatium sp. WMS1]